MRWLVALVMVVGACAEDNEFRPIEAIPPVDCDHQSGLVAGHVFGEIKMASGTRSFGSVSSLGGTADLVSLGDGAMTLNIGVTSVSETTAMYRGDIQFATASHLVGDCPGGGRFVALFDAGNLSGWYWAASNGW